MANLSNPLLYRINYHWQTNTQVNLKNRLGCKSSNKNGHMWSCWKQFFFQPKGIQENMFAFEVLLLLGMDPVFKGRMSVIDSAFLSSDSFLKSISTFRLHTTQQSLAANWPKVVPIRGQVMQRMFIFLESGWHGHSSRSSLLSLWFIELLPGFISSKSVRFILGSSLVNNILFYV